MRRKIILTGFGLIIIAMGCALPFNALLTPTPVIFATPVRAEPTNIVPVPATSLPTAMEPPPTPGEAPTRPQPTETANPTRLPGIPTFSNLTSGDPVIISFIQMVSPTNGWAIGAQDGTDDHILRTADGGQTWADVTPPEPALKDSSQTKTAIGFFADDQNAWVTYGASQVFTIPETPVIWFTNDSGQTWQPGSVLDLSGAEEFYTPGYLNFADLQHGWYLVHVGAGMHHDYSLIFATSDGGITWERIADPYSPGIDGLMSLPITGLVFADSQWGWATKDNQGVRPGAYLVETRDGGRSWETLFLPAPPEVDWLNEPVACRTGSPQFPAEHTGAVFVNCRGFSGEDQAWSYFYITRDEGQTWDHIMLPSKIEQLTFLEAQSGYAFGRHIYLTSDQGNTWTETKTVNWDGQFSFVDMALGWAVARSNDEIALVKTSDGSRTWELIEPTLR